MLHAKAQDKGTRGGSEQHLHPDVMEPPQLPALEREQKRVNDVVASGGIVDWREAGEWLRQAREEDGEVGLGDHYTRVSIRKLFDRVSKTPRCGARVVSGRKGLHAGGNGCDVCLLLFPTVASGQLAVDL